MFPYRYRRPLIAALLFSLLLHLVLLFGFGWPVRLHPAPAGAAMQVHVGGFPSPAPAPTPAAAPPRPAAAPQKLVVPREIPRQEPAPQPAPAAIASAVAAAPAGDAGRAAAPAGPPAENAVSPVDRGGEVVSADALRQYRIDLASAARRFRSYPAMARARGWEGTVELAVVVPAGGLPPLVRLVRSSGHAVLDEQAQAMLQQAVRVAPLPDSLRNRELNVALPIRFSLDEG